MQTVPACGLVSQNFHWRWDRTLAITSNSVSSHNHVHVIRNYRSLYRSKHEIGSVPRDTGRHLCSCEIAGHRGQWWHTLVLLEILLWPPVTFKILLRDVPAQFVIKDVYHIVLLGLAVSTAATYRWQFTWGSGQRTYRSDCYSLHSARRQTVVCSESCEIETGLNFSQSSKPSLLSVHIAHLSPWTSLTALGCTLPVSPLTQFVAFFSFSLPGSSVW